MTGRGRKPGFHINEADGRYGKLFVVSIFGKSKNGTTKWLCQCDCGKTSVVFGTSLRSGATVSCGCVKGRQKTHGQEGTPTHTSWKSMKGRCANPNNPDYKHYGGRGITYCSQWETFEGFLADMGLRPIGTSIDRKDNDGNYEPGNCRWATPVVQANNKRNNIRKKAA